MIALLVKWIDHSRGHVKTQKHDMFARNTIIVAVLINNALCKVCDHTGSLLYFDHFVRIAIIITVLKNKTFL